MKTGSQGSGDRGGVSGVALTRSVVGCWVDRGSSPNSTSLHVLRSAPIRLLRIEAFWT